MWWWTIIFKGYWDYHRAKWGIAYSNVICTLQQADTSTFTGIERPEMFKAIFEMLKPKSQVMTY